MLPNFLVIGAQKSGTTFVQRCLNEHPDAFIPLEEIPFFEDPWYSSNNVDTFKSLFQEGKNKKAIGLKRPNYLAKAECAERIHKHLPSAKLITILRDPVDRAISAYYHYAKFGFAPIKHVNRGLLEIMKGRHAGKYPRAREIIEFGFYYKWLERYLGYFERKQILIMLYDEIVKNCHHSIKKICQFLEIDSEYAPRSLNSRPQAGVYSILRLKLLALRNPIVYSYSADRTRLTPRDEIGPHGAMLVRIINLVDRKVVWSLDNSRPPLNRDAAKALSDVYRGDTSKLEGLLNSSLAHWKVFRRFD